MGRPSDHHPSVQSNRSLGDHAEGRLVETLTAKVVPPFNRGGESPSHSPTMPMVGRMAELGSHSIALLRKASAIGQFLGLSGLLKSLLDQQSFCMRGSANAQREGQGVNEEGLNKHGWVEWVPGGSAP